MRKFAKHIQSIMMKSFIQRIALLLVLLWMHPAQAGKYANAFLEIGCGARAMSLGGAVTSFIDDGTAFYWNPAGLSFIKSTQISGMYGPQFGTIQNPLANYHYMGIAQPLIGDAVIAVNWIRLAVDEIPIFPDLLGESYYERLINPGLRPTGEPVGYLSDIENAVFISFAKQNHIRANLGWVFNYVQMDIPFGVNIKWIRQSIGSYSASGIGVDIGAMIRISMADLAQNKRLGTIGFGMQLQDITRSTMNWNTRHQDIVPINAVFGLSYEQAVFRNKGKIIISIDRESRWGGRNRMGLELQGFNRLFLRVGSVQSHFMGGMGINLWKFTVDYAFQTHELDALHRVSCSFSF